MTYADLSGLERQKVRNALLRYLMQQPGASNPELRSAAYYGTGIRASIPGSLLEKLRGRLGVLQDRTKRDPRKTKLAILCHYFVYGLDSPRYQLLRELREQGLQPPSRKQLKEIRKQLRDASAPGT